MKVNKSFILIFSVPENLIIILLKLIFNIYNITLIVFTNEKIKFILLKFSNYTFNN